MNAEGQTEFFQSEIDQPHPERTRAILRAHPEVRQLLGRNPFTAVIMLTVLSIQTAIAFWMGRLGMHYWWLSLLIAFCVGAFMNHCMYVIIHDATHNLIFKNKTWNKLAAIFADLANLVPGAIGFSVYHLKHHAHQGDYEYDADIASRWEARLIGNKWYRKALWLLFFPFFPTDAAAAFESDHDVEPMELFQSRLRHRLRCVRDLFLRLARGALSRFFLRVFDRAASGGRAVDSGALHLRFRPGDV